MKKLLALAIISFLTLGCFPESEGPDLDTVFGEVRQELELDWSNLPAGENVASTGVLTFSELIEISTDDFDSPEGAAVIAPQLIGMSYDIRSIETGNTIGLIELNIVARAAGGFSQRLLDHNIVTPENTVTLDSDGNEVFEEITIFDLENPGNTDQNGLTLLTQTMARGYMSIDFNLIGKNIDLITSGERFEMILTLELAGNIEAQ